MARFLFATHFPYLPERVGGSERVTHELCVALGERGHTCGVLAGLLGKGATGFTARLRRKLSPTSDCARDRALGYPVYRTWVPQTAVAEVLHRFAPSTVIIQAGLPALMANAFLEHGARVVLYFHDVEFADLGADIRRHPNLTFLANSHFTASRVHDRYAITAPVIPPLITPTRYAVPSTRRNVLFVNPHPLKGVEVALEMARQRPDIPFDFIEAWAISRDQNASHRDQAARLANVRWRSSISDMRKVYANTRLVLMPSVWEESWGRVVSEAQVSGIPALASNTGGLPEAVGPGGMLVDRQADLSDWLHALSQLWDDDARYDHYARAARTHSHRPEFQPNAVVSRFIEQTLGPDPEDMGATYSESVAY